MVRRFLMLGIALLSVLGGCRKQPPVPGGMPDPSSKPSSLSMPPIGPPPATSPTPLAPRRSNIVLLDIILVEIPAGSFLMGAPPTEPGYDPKQRQRLVAMSEAFWLGQTEVTQAQFERVMGRNPSLTKNPLLPVTSVTWNEVQEFLVLANAQSPAFRLRLPREEEWEYACRAGSELPFAPPEGKTDELESALHKHHQGDPEYLVRYVGRSAWFHQSQPQTVGTLLPNAWHLFDMHGNVWEWCDEESLEEELRPLRGGAWSTSDVFGCRCALRAWEPKDTRKDSIGFRILAEPR